MGNCPKVPLLEPCPLLVEAMSLGRPQSVTTEGNLGTRWSVPQSLLAMAAKPY